MLQLGTPAIVMLVGGVTYALSNNAKVGEIGRILFFVGALTMLFHLRA